MRVLIYDDAGIEETEAVGDTAEGCPIPRVGECIRTANPKLRGEVIKVSYHFDLDRVFITVKKI